MTVRRKDDEALVEVGWGMKTKAYRLVLLGVAFGATPMGQNLLNNVGVKTPVMQELTELRAEVASVKSDVAHLKEDVAAVRGKSDKLEISFTGFQVDFDKFRKEQK